MVRKVVIVLFTLALLVAAAIFAGIYYRTHRYDKLILQVAPKYKLDPALVKAVIYEESYFDPKAHSSQNAIGLMQVTSVAAQEWVDSTHARNLAAALAVVTNDYYGRSDVEIEDALTNPTVNLHVGCWYLQSLISRYRNKPSPVAVALAAYNAGPTNVERWANDDELTHLSPEEFIARIEFPVTRNYVQKILERYRDYKSDGRI
jgi:soluble lytic murein transglycosylase